MCPVIAFVPLTASRRACDPNTLLDRAGLDRVVLGRRRPVRVDVIDLLRVHPRIAKRPLERRFVPDARPDAGPWDDALPPSGRGP